jgi:Zn-dependent peptidase ImmA (M78 family)
MEHLNRFETDEAEQEANFFAASLLMPRQFLETDLANKG